MAPLADVAEVVMGQSPPSHTYNETGEGLPFFQGKAEFGSLHPNVKKWCNAPARIAETGNILLSIRAPVGPTNLAKSRCAIGRGLAALRPLKGIEAKFLLYAVRAYENQLVEQGTGSTFQAVGKVVLHHFTIPVAPVGEQRRIVAEIEKHFSRLDAAVAALERARTNLERYRASVLKAACEGRLVPTEAELARLEGLDYEPADRLLERILAERRRRWEQAELEKLRAKGKEPKGDSWKKKYQEPHSPTSSGRSELPEGWCWISMDIITPLGAQNGLYLPQSRYGEGTPILRIDDFQNDWSRSSGELRRVAADADDLRKYSLATGDLIVNRVNSPSHLGKSLAIERRHLPSLFESNMMRLSLSELVDPQYVVACLRSSTGRQRLLQNAKWAVNQASINQGDVLNTLVPLPPLQEQRRIAVEVARQLSFTAGVLETLRTNLRRAERLRQSILKRAFEGKLVPQDPDDEPASVLLERIRAEREAASRNGKTRRRRKRRASSEG